MPAEHIRETYEEQLALVEHTAGRVAYAFDNIRAHFLRCRNTFSTVNNLPPDLEVLSHIFRLAACSGSVLHTNLTLASICSHWRAVSLSDPVMWSFFDPTATANYTELAIRRAQSVPISILRSPNKQSTHGILVKLAISHLHRIYTLQLRGSTSLLAKFSGMPAPLLEELYLHNHGSPDDPSVFLSGPDAPHISCLILRQCMLRLDQPSRELQKLTTIHIIFDGAKNAEGFHRSILDLCQASPNLEVLSISCNLDRVVPRILAVEPGPPRSPVHMARLTSFDIELPPTITAYLIRSLKFPKKLETFQMVTVEGNEEASWLWTHSYIPPTLLLDTREIEISFEFSQGISLYCSRQELNQADRELCGGVYVDYTLPPKKKAYDILTPVVSYILDTPTPRLKHLEFIQTLRSGTKTSTPDLEWITASLRRLLAGMSSLTSISLRLTSAKILVGLQSRLLDITGNPMLPALERCTLQVSSKVCLRTVLSLIRQLCPANLETLHFEDTTFKVRSLQEAHEFVRDNLAGLAREVWVTGSSISVAGAERHSVRRYWRHDSECPLKVGDVGSVLKI